VKPDLVIKGGIIAGALMGDPNASIPTPEPVRYRPMFGALGRATGAVSWTFVSQAAVDEHRLPSRVERRLLPVGGTRALGKRDMILNDALPQIEVDPDRYTVVVDGEPIVPRPAATLPMTQRYFLF
jgi:urease subunit alpha